MEYMSLQPAVSLHGGRKIDTSKMEGSVHFKDVTFSYPSRKDQVHVHFA